MRVTSSNLAYLLIDVDCCGLEPEVVLIRFVYAKLAEMVVTTCIDFTAAVQEECEVTAT